MKTTMKLSLAVVLMAGFTVGARAQSANDHITGRASVNTTISVKSLNDLDFGVVSPGLAKTIDLSNVATGGSVGEGNEETGIFTVGAEHLSNVQVQFTTLPINLINGVNTLAIGTWTAAWGITNPYVSGNTFVAGTGTQIASGDFPTNVIGAENAIYVFVGATVTPTVDQPSGQYTADIVLTATYN